MILVRAQNTRMPIEMLTVETGLLKCQTGMRTLLGIVTGGHSCYIEAKNLPTLCPCCEALWEAEFKGDRLINLPEGF
jgi:hypothetical protein